MSELKIGDTIHWEGREYVIIMLSHLQDTEGYVLKFDALDTLRAQQHLEGQRNKRKHIEESLKLLPKFERMANEALDIKPDD